MTADLSSRSARVDVSGVRKMAALMARNDSRAVAAAYLALRGPPELLRTHEKPPPGCASLQLAADAQRYRARAVAFRNIATRKHLAASGR